MPRMYTAVIDVADPSADAVQHLLEKIEQNPLQHEFFVAEMSDGQFIQGFPLTVENRGKSPTRWHLEKPSDSYNRHSADLNLAQLRKAVTDFLQGRSWQTLVAWTAEQESPGKLELTTLDKEVVTRVAAVFRSAGQNRAGERDFAESLAAGVDRGFLDDGQVTSLAPFLEGAVTAETTDRPALVDLLQRCQSMLTGESR